MQMKHFAKFSFWVEYLFDKYFFLKKISANLQPFKSLFSIAVSNFNNPDHWESILKIASNPKLVFCSQNQLYTWIIRNRGDCELQAGKWEPNLVEHNYLDNENRLFFVM